MSYMNITKIENEEGSYHVDYVADHTPHDIIVDEKTARLTVQIMTRNFIEWIERREKEANSGRR